jgi:nucleotide-binding universal stress UspA family protein
MSILCVTDFSKASEGAVDVAAQLARRKKTALHLLLAGNKIPVEASRAEREQWLAADRRAMDAEAQRLRALGTEVHTHIEADASEAAVRRAATSCQASLLVLGAEAQKPLSPRSLASTVHTLAQHAQLPILRISERAPFDAWLERKRPLKLLVGLDFNAASKSAWAWAKQMADYAPVSIGGVHLYWPPEAFSRLGLTGVHSYEESAAKVESVLCRELQAQFVGGPGVTVQLKAIASMGRPAERLLAAAAEQEADLLVVGSHHRSALEHFIEGSTSAVVVDRAPLSVACVPIDEAHRITVGSPIKSVLVATDFSPTGNAAVNQAYSLIAPGGIVYLTHIVDPPANFTELAPHDILDATHIASDIRSERTEKLQKLIPLRQLLLDKYSQVLLLVSSKPATAIVQAAERLGVDVICIGTHGRSGLSKVIMGSVAQAVLTKTPRPVLLVKPIPE